MASRLTTRSEAETVGLPLRTFLYTLDQVGFLSNLTVEVVKERYVHFDGRSPGVRPRGKLLARNIALAGEVPDWRVAEAELVRWLKVLGFSVRDTWRVKS